VSKALIAQSLEHSTPLPCPWCGRAEQAEIKIKELKSELRGATLRLCAKGDHATPPQSFVEVTARADSLCGQFKGELGEGDREGVREL
jgi:hypothetical protein